MRTSLRNTFRVCLIGFAASGGEGCESSDKAATTFSEFTSTVLRRDRLLPSNAATLPERLPPRVVFPRNDLTLRLRPTRLRSSTTSVRTLSAWHPDSDAMLLTHTAMAATRLLSEHKRRP
jgi:hypothetical protein